MDRLRILVVSDQHEEWSKLDYVKKWFAEENQGTKFDYVFMCGDQANCQNQCGEPADPLENEKASQSNQRYISELEHCAEPGHLLYIPGNHDSEEMFSQNPPQWGTSVNVHLKSYELASGLHLASMGGAGPIHAISKTTGLKELIWPHAPYPFKTDVEYK